MKKISHLSLSTSKEGFIKLQIEKLKISLELYDWDEINYDIIDCQLILLLDINMRNQNNPMTNEQFVVEIDANVPLIYEEVILWYKFNSLSN